MGMSRIFSRKARIAAPVAALTLALAMGIARPGWSHHSRAEFADGITEIRGTLVNIIWRNPHPALFIDVTGDGGEPETWRMETFGGLWSFEQANVSPDLFRVGDTLTVAGRLSTRRDAYFLGTNVLLPDGTEVIMGVNFGPHWDGPFVGGATEFSGQHPTVVDAAGENLGIFRVWSIPGRGVGLTQHLPFRPHAVAARADWDPIDNPITRCEQPGMPTVMLQPGPFRFLRAGEDIVLHSPYFDTRRTIHMDREPDAATQPVSPVGFSRGHWEGNTLVVATTRIGWPYFDSSGTPQGPAVQVTERFTLSDDQSRLAFHMTVVDPETFTGPATREWHYLALGEEFFVIDCNVF